MSFLEGLVLGTVQGITEWLPVSSEGINTLILLRYFDKPIDEAISFSIWLHTGTLLAALVYFREDISELLKHLPTYMRDLGTRAATERDSLTALTTFLIVSTLLTGAVGGPLFLLGLDDLDMPADVIMAVIGGLLIVTGLVQKLTRRLSGGRTSPSLGDALLLGVVQAFSVLPGLSRSGLTVSALLFRGYENKAAIRMSFLMSVPVVLGAGIGLAVSRGVSYDLAAVAGVVASFVFGLLAIGAVMKIAARVQFWAFCVILGMLSLGPLLVERL